MRAPESAQQLQGWRRQWHVTIFLALAMDVQEQAATVHIRHLQPAAFQQAQPAGIDCDQTSAIDGNAHLPQNPAHLGAAQHHGQFPLARRPHKAQGGPGLLQCLFIEELDAAERWWRWAGQASSR